MRDLSPVCRAITWIEAHLRDDVTVAEMAGVTGYSLYHFIRAFNQAVWHTPYDYLMRRRLSEAAQDLVTGNRRVIEIALDYRFNNHETFSRAFKRLFGMQPVQWRERGTLPRGALMPAFSCAYLEHIQQPDIRHPRQVRCVRRSLAGLMTSLSAPADASSRVWHALGQILPLGLPHFPQPDFWGVTSYLDGQGAQAFYLAACELVASEVELPPLLVCQTLPAGDYICMPQPALQADLQHTLTYLYHTWLPKAGLQPAFPVEIVAFGATPPWTDPSAAGTLWLPVKMLSDGQRT